MSGPAVTLLLLMIAFPRANAEQETAAAPVFDLLAARTANIDSGHRFRLVYHHPDGRMAGADEVGGRSRAGRWWVDGKGNYCFLMRANEETRCYQVHMNGETLELVSTMGGAVVAVRKLVPGDVHQLLETVDPGDAPCDCRPGRRRGARGG